MVVVLRSDWRGLSEAASPLMCPADPPVLPFQKKEPDLILRHQVGLRCPKRLKHCAAFVDQTNYEQKTQIESDSSPESFGHRYRIRKGFHNVVVAFILRHLLIAGGVPSLDSFSQHTVFTKLIILHIKYGNFLTRFSATAPTLYA